MSALWLPCTQMQTLDAQPPLKVVRGQGAYLFDEQDNGYIDAISSWWVNLHGHCHPYINENIKQQLDTLEHTLLAGVVHPSIEKLAQKLVKLTPEPLTKVFFADSGSAAVECALKMSLQYWHQSGHAQKNTFVSLEHGYHGETLGSLSVTDIPLFSKQYAPLLVNHLRLPSPADLFCPTGKSQSQHEADTLAELSRILSTKSEKICALILEPLVQGAAGMAMYSAGFLAKAKALCDTYSIHLIADEIAVGFGRTGSMFACQQAGVSPDFLCLSKGLTAGYLPMSCVLTTDEVYAAFLDDRLERGFLHSHSFTGNPLAATAALASLELFEKDSVLESNQKLAAQLSKNLSALSNSPYIQNPRQTGMIAAFTVVSQGLLSKHIHTFAKTKGVLVRPIGNHVYVMPPYCISPSEIAKVFSVLGEAVDFALTQPNSNTTTDPKLLA